MIFDCFEIVQDMKIISPSSCNKLILTNFLTPSTTFSALARLTRNSNIEKCELFVFLVTACSCEEIKHSPHPRCVKHWLVLTVPFSSNSSTLPFISYNFCFDSLLNTLDTSSCSKSLMMNLSRFQSCSLSTKFCIFTFNTIKSREHTNLYAKRCAFLLNPPE